MTKCPFCGSGDYEYYIAKNMEKQTDWFEHKCLKCRKKWRYRKGEVEELI